MIFTYDKNKSAANREKHGVDFESAQEIWQQQHLVLEGRDVQGEQRYLAIGPIGKRLYSAIFAMRHNSIRIISCRRARKSEERLYEETWKDNR